jgi:hypothetical protein
MLRDDSEVDSWISYTLRYIIYKLQDAQKNLRSIADDCERNDDDDAFIIY